MFASEKMRRKLEPPALDDKLFKALEIVGGKAELHSCAVTSVLCCGVHAPW